MIDTAKKILLLSVLFSQIAANLSPLVFIPGTGGNQLEARLDKPSVEHFYCAKRADWYRIWISVTELLPGSINCWSENMKLHYNETTDSLSNAPGVEIRVPGEFGDTEPAEYLDPSLKMSASVYFKPLADSLMAQGYERRKNFFAAAYDFRLAPTSNTKYYHDTVALIEKAYELNNQTKVTLLSHSMGGLWTQYILNQQSKEWKDKYIKWWVTVNGVFGGSAKMMKVMASGDNEGVKVVTGRDTRSQQRSSESNFWLLPNPAYWDQDKVLIQTPSKNFTVKDYEEFFSTIEYPVGSKLRRRIEQIQLSAPEVHVFSVYGLGVDTMEKAIYNNGFETDPEEVFGDGDGTVNRNSLEVPLRWTSQQSEPVESKIFPGECHGCLLVDPNAIEFITKIIVNK